VSKGPNLPGGGVSVFFRTWSKGMGKKEENLGKREKPPSGETRLTGSKEKTWIDARFQESTFVRNLSHGCFEIH